MSRSGGLTGVSTLLGGNRSLPAVFGYGELWHRVSSGMQTEKLNALLKAAAIYVEPVWLGLFGLAGTEDSSRGRAQPINISTEIK